MEKYNLQEPSDDIQNVLKRIAVKLGKTQRIKAITGVGKKTLLPQILLTHNVEMSPTLVELLDVVILPSEVTN